MASIRQRTRRDGTDYYAVLYRHDGKQRSTSFEDFASAKQFADLATKFGPANALETLSAAEAASSGITVGAWLERYIDHLTGVQRDTVVKYRAYAKRDIDPMLGDIPLAALNREHVARCVNAMREPSENGQSPASKTIANKLGFLSAALSAAVPRYIDANPATRMRLPRGGVRERIALTPE